MTALKISLCAAVATLALGAASAASAADSGVALSYNAGVSSQYVFRGLDQTGGNSNAEVFGGVDAAISQFYLGGWASTTSFAGDNGYELDIYGGWKPTLGPVALDVGFYTYNYNKSRSAFVTPKADTVEYKLGGSIPAGGFTLGAVTYYSPDNNGLQLLIGTPKKTTSWYTEGNVAYTLKNKVGVSAAYGYTSVKYGALSGHYATWNAGVTFPVTDKVGLDVRYVGTDKKAVPLGGFSGGVATIKASF